MKKNSIWAEVKNDYCCKAEKKVYIAAWKTFSVTEESKIIAIVNCITKKVEYLDDRAKTDIYAQEVIKDTLEKIDKGSY